MPPPLSLSPVPEDELAPPSQWRERPTAASSNPNLRTSLPNGWSGNGNAHGRGGGNGGVVNGNGHSRRPPPRPRPQSYPNVKEPYHSYYSPRSQDTDSMNLRASEQFFVPPPPGTVTVASRLSDVDINKRPWYRRKYMVVIYGCSCLIIVGVIVAVVIVFGR
jgi:hypothetical protein